MKHFLQIITVISVLTVSVSGYTQAVPESTDLGTSEGQPWDSIVPKFHPKPKTEMGGPETTFFSRTADFLDSNLRGLEHILRMPIRYLRRALWRWRSMDNKNNSQGGNFLSLKTLVSLASLLTIIALLFLLLYFFGVKGSSKTNQEDDQNLSDPCLKKISKEKQVFFDCIETLGFEDNLSVEEDDEERRKAEAITQYLLDARKNGELYRQDTDRVTVALAFPEDKRQFSSETPSPLSEGRYPHVKKTITGGSWDPEGREAKGNKNDESEGIRARVSSLNLPKKQVVLKN